MNFFYSCFNNLVKNFIEWLKIFGNVSSFIVFRKLLIVVIISLYVSFGCLFNSFRNIENTFSIGFISSQKKYIKLYKMENGRYGCINRDFNSVNNMKKITEYWLKNGSI
jgi:hypothetical protein